MILLNNEANCESCGWKGRPEELVAAHFSHDLGSDDQVLEIFAREIRNTFAAVAAKDMGLLLQKWGFLVGNTKQEQVKSLTRYLTVIARAIATSVLEERKAIAKENPNVL
jgi:hypothetical protein